MTTINPKSISTKDVYAAYDLALAFYEADPEAVPGDQTAADHAQSQLYATLKDLSFPRVDNLKRLIDSHNAAVANKKQVRSSPGTASDTGRLVAETACATTFAATSNETPQSDGAADMTDTDTAVAEPQEDVAAKTAPTTSTLPVEGTFEVAPGADALINPTIDAATSGNVKSITDLLEAHDRVAAKIGEMNAAIDAHEAAIAAHKAGEENVDESKAIKPEKFDLTGFADLDTGNQMVPVLDSLIEQHVSPKTSFAAIVGAIQTGENTISEGAQRLKTLARDLRQARPKSRQRVATEAVEQSYADSLSEIDDLNANVEVVYEIAADLFPNCYGSQTQQILQFEVPKLEFEADHPDVPAKDDSFQFNTRVVVEALHSIAENEIIWLYGESGCGKSEFWAQIAGHLNMPFTRMNMDGHLTRSDIIGVNRLVAGDQGHTEMRFVEGILPRAMARPGILLIDEMDLGDPEFMPILQPVLEGNPLVLLEDGGRIVRPHPMFRIAITGNTIGLGSDNQMYLNAFEQSAATRDRISAFVNMPYMPQDIEERVVLARHPNADTEFVGNLVKLANKVRDGYRNGDIQTLFSTRAVLYCAKRHSRLAHLYPTPDDAARDILETVIMNRLDNGSTQTVKELVDQIFA